MTGVVDAVTHGLEHSQFHPNGDGTDNIRFTGNGHLRPDILYPLNHLDNPANRAILLEHIPSNDETTLGYVNQLYDEDGRWIAFGSDDLPGLYRRPVHEIRTEIKRRTEAVYSLVDYRLLAEKPPNGFSKHNWKDHIVPTAEIAQHIATLGGYDDQTKQYIEIAAGLHDLGNLIDRGSHEFEAMPIAVSLIPNLLDDPYGLAVVTAAIELHNEKSFIGEIHKLGKMSGEEKVAWLKSLGYDRGLEEHLPYVAAALKLADIADTDRRRTNEAAINGFALKDDPHVRVVVCSRNNGFWLSDDGSTLVHKIDFNPYIIDEEYKKYEDIARQTGHPAGHRIDMPQFVLDLHKGHGIPQFDQWKNDYKRIYRDRVLLSALLAPVAIPGVRYFVLELHDRVDPSDPNVGETSREVFSPPLFEQHGVVYDQKYVERSRRKKDPTFVRPY